MQYYQKEFKMSSRKLHCFEVSSIAPNVPFCALRCGGFNAQIFNYKLNFKQGTNADFFTLPAILQNTCYLPFIYQL